MLWSRLTAAVVIETAVSVLLGRIAIPLLRKAKTGKFEPYVGDRFKTDGSEPAFGGAVMCAALLTGLSLSGISGQQLKVTAAAVGLVLLITFIGVTEDVLSDIYAKPFGIKRTVKLGLIYSVCLLFMLLIKLLSQRQNGLIMPFHAGYLMSGAVYPFFGAAVMTAVIYAFMIHERLGSDESGSIGGLCACSLGISALGLSAVGTIMGDSALAAFACCTAACCIGSLLWGFEPSKLRYGSSGGAFCAVCAAALFSLCKDFGLAALMTFIPVFADAVCCLLQTVIFKTRKRLLLKGFTLHAHLKAKGVNVYKIMIIFFAASAVFTAAGCVYARYCADIEM